MPTKKYHVALSQQDRQQLARVAASTKKSTQERARARILLLADTNQEGGGHSDGAIVKAVRSTSAQTVHRTRRRFAEQGLEAALKHKEQQNRKKRLLDGKAEAHLVALVCGTAPDGHKRWSLNLLKDTLIEQGFVDSVSHETVRQTLKKTNSSPG